MSPLCQSGRVLHIGIRSALLSTAAPAQVEKFACNATQQLEQSYVQNNFHMGQSIAAGGDFNGDGHKDIAMGGYARSSAGPTQITPVVIFLGTGGSPPFRHRLTIRGAATFDLFGFATAFIGDLTGDGCDELVVGAPRFDGAVGADSGRVFLIYGDDSLVADEAFNEEEDVTTAAAITDLTFDGLEAGEWFGAAVATAQDSSGAFLKDLLIGAPGAGPVNEPSAHLGRVYQVETTTMEAAGVLGGSLPGVAVGALTSSGGTPGISGSLPTGYLLTSHRLLQGDDPGDRFGHAIAFVGDLTGGSAQEFLVGAPQYQAELDGFMTMGTGYARLYKLSSATPLIEIEGTQDATGNPPRGGEAFGFAVAGMVQLNPEDDSTPDLLIGAPLFNANDFGGGGEQKAGRVRAYSGADAAMDIETPLFDDGVPNYTRFVGEHGSDQFGFAVIGVPDIHDDNSDEILVGAWQAEIDDDTPCTNDRQGDGGSASLFSPVSATPGSPIVVFYGEAFRDHLGRALGTSNLFGVGTNHEIVLSGLAWTDPDAVEDEVGKGYVWDGDTVLQADP